MRPTAEPAELDLDSEATREPEIGTRQVRLDAQLPRPTPPSRSERDTADRRRGGSVTRYAPAQESFTRSVRSLEPISDLEAAAFAGRFAVDFQSFDEDRPTRRAEVLRPLLADPQASTWGWTGVGRQRADSPLPGRLYRSSDTVVFVEVVVRVTTYSRACPLPERVEPPEVEPPDLRSLVGPSSAPPEADPRWVAGEATWIRMTVPITRAYDGRLVVDPELVPTSS